MGRSHRRTSSLKLSASPRIDFATSSSSVHVMCGDGRGGASMLTGAKPIPGNKTVAAGRESGPDHYSLPGPNTQTLCELAQTEPVAVESRVPTQCPERREPDD